MGAGVWTSDTSCTNSVCTNGLINCDTYDLDYLLSDETTGTLSGLTGNVSNNANFIDWINTIYSINGYSTNWTSSSFIALIDGTALNGVLNNCAAPVERGGNLTATIFCDNGSTPKITWIKVVCMTGGTPGCSWGYVPNVAPLQRG